MLLPDPGMSQALLIGVASYDKMEDLPAVENNLDGLRRAFVNRDLWGLPADHCTIMSGPSSGTEVVDALRTVASRVSDTLVVYFAGHGLVDPITEELYLGLPGSNQERLHAALPYEWLRREMVDHRVRALRKVLILDCCYGARAMLGAMGPAASLGDKSQIEGSYLLTSAAETRKALSPPGETYTAFTGELIALLEAGVDGGPDLLDLDTIFEHLDRVLRAKSRPVPQRRDRNRGGQVALARNRAFLPAAPVVTAADGAYLSSQLADLPRPIALVQLPFGPVAIFDEDVLLRLIQRAGNLNLRKPEASDG